MRRATSHRPAASQAREGDGADGGSGASVKLTPAQQAQLSRLAAAPYNGASRLAPGNGWDARVIRALQALKLVRVIDGSARNASEGLVVMLTATGHSRVKGGA